jgi:hypothetical protein
MLLLDEDCGIHIWRPPGERRWTCQEGRHRARALTDAGVRRVLFTVTDDRPARDSPEPAPPETAHHRAVLCPEAAGPACRRISADTTEIRFFAALFHAPQKKFLLLAWSRRCRGPLKMSVRPPSCRCPCRLGRHLSARCRDRRLETRSRGLPGAPGSARWCLEVGAAASHTVI